MRIEISVGGQTLALLDEGGSVLRHYRVSTAANGVGERNGSLCTPRGRHVIRAKVGRGASLNTVFVERRRTGEIFSEALFARYPGRDWILTRILWLSGCEPGFNRLGEVDTMRRCVYIHGTPERTVLGMPGSKGCVRMANRDIVELFDLVPAGTPVEIRVR